MVVTQACLKCVGVSATGQCVVTGATVQEIVTGGGIGGLVDGTATNDTTGLSFLSFTYPFKSWAIAVYRHELANFEANYNTFGARFDVSDDGQNFFTTRYFPVRVGMDLDIVNYGFSAAVRLNESFKIGAGVSYYEFEIDSFELEQDEVQSVARAQVALRKRA